MASLYKDPNQQRAPRSMLTRQDIEAAKARNNFDRECRKLENTNDANAQFWSEQDEKTKR